MKTRRKCIDPKIGGNIPLEIVMNIAAGKVPPPVSADQEPVLSSEACAHLQDCEACREGLRKNLALWYEKAIDSLKDNEAYDIVLAARNGDTTITTKAIASGIAYFKINSEGRTGLCVVVSNGQVHHAELKTIAEFDAMR